MIAKYRESLKRRLTILVDKIVGFLAFFICIFIFMGKGMRGIAKMVN